MENKSSLNQLVFCKVCKITVKLTFEHYKRCNKQNSIKIFYFDIKNNKWKNESQGIYYYNYIEVLLIAI
jgi:hypothetical protein